MPHFSSLLLSLQDLLPFQDHINAAVALLRVWVSFSRTLPTPAHQATVTMKLQVFSLQLQQGEAQHGQVT